MTTPPRTVSATAGVAWPFRAMALFRHSPTGFAVLALVYGVLTQASSWLLQALSGATAAMAALAYLILATLLVVGMLLAAHEHACGRRSDLPHLLGRFRGGSTGAFVSMLIPQIAILLLCVLIVYLVLGPEDLQRLGEIATRLLDAAESGAAIDPDAILALPFLSLLLTLALLLGVGLLSLVFGLTMIPDLLLGRVGLMKAMANSAVACLRHPGAIVLMLIAALCLCVCCAFGIGILQEIGRLLVGDAAIVVGQVLAHGALTALFAGTTYYAWREMVAGADAASA